MIRLVVPLRLARGRRRCWCRWRRVEQPDDGRLGTLGGDSGGAEEDGEVEEPAFDDSGRLVAHLPYDGAYDDGEEEAGMFGSPVTVSLFR